MGQSRTWVLGLDRLDRGNLPLGVHWHHLQTGEPVVTTNTHIATKDMLPAILLARTECFFQASFQQWEGILWASGKAVVGTCAPMGTIFATSEVRK